MKRTRPSEELAVVATIDPDAYGAGTEVSDWINIADFSRIMAVVMVGTLGTNATIDAKLEQAQDASGTGAKDVANSDITQLTQAGTDQSDTQAIIEAWAEDLDVENNFTHMRLSLTIGTAASDAGGIVMGMGARFGPASDSDLASVEEIVTV
jgi:hypothetical protein